MRNFGGQCGVELAEGKTFDGFAGLAKRAAVGKISELSILAAFARGLQA